MSDYIRTRCGMRSIQDVRNGFWIGYYAPEKRGQWYSSCGVMDCYWESGTYGLELVELNLIEHYETIHLLPTGVVIKAGENTK